MPVVRIEHPVADYDAWKQAFDRDPIGREQIGVRRYRVLRSTTDDGSTYVMVDLELDTDEQAHALRVALEELWGQVQPMGLIGDQVLRIAELVEAVEVRPTS
jgi:hypothetical protein